ncbi:MAG: TolC family protein [Candidatus Gastranaerophilales bacterium]|nr:TolC family protein [Candidatus Gastranaerophilales bacterium]
MAGKSKTVILSFIAVFLINCYGALAGEVKNAQIEKVDLNFATAYELMMTNNNAIKAVLEEINAKKYEKNAAVGEFLPKIGINTTYIHFNEDIAVETAPLRLGGTLINVPPTTLQNQDLWLTSVGATWNIFTGGKILALNSAARAKLESSNQKYRVLTNELIIELIKRYYGLKFAADVVEVKKQVADTTKQHLEDAKKLEAQGIIPKSERLHAQVAHRQAQRDYNTALKDADIIEEGLKTLIKADNIDLTGVKVAPCSCLFIYEQALPKLADFKQAAMKDNPNLKQMEAKAKLAQANYRSKAANYSPTVSLFAYDILGASNLSHQIPTFAVGAKADMLLFDGFSRYNNLKAADAVRKQVKYETIDTKNNIESLVTKNYNEVFKYKEQYESTDQSVESAQEALRTAALAFQEGVGTSLAVIDAQTALSSVKIQRLNALYNYDVMLAELLSTNGSAEGILQYIKNSREEHL